MCLVRGNHMQYSYSQSDESTRATAKQDAPSSSTSAPSTISATSDCRWYFSRSVRASIGSAAVQNSQVLSARLTWRSTARDQRLAGPDLRALPRAHCFCISSRSSQLCAAGRALSQGTFDELQVVGDLAQHRQCGHHQAPGALDAQQARCLAAIWLVPLAALWQTESGPSADPNHLWHEAPGRCVYSNYRYCATRSPAANEMWRWKQVCSQTFGLVVECGFGHSHR